MKIVIEDYFGNDLCSFFIPDEEVHPSQGIRPVKPIVSRLKNCDIADKDIDEDGNEYIRVQLTSPLIADKV